MIFSSNSANSTSGTVGAALEAANQGTPAIAFSLQVEDQGDKFDDPRFHGQSFDAAKRVVADICRTFLDSPFPEGADVINVNIPSPVKGDYEVTRLAEKLFSTGVERRLDPGGRPYFWINGPLIAIALLLLVALSRAAARQRLARLDHHGPGKPIVERRLIWDLNRFATTTRVLSDEAVFGDMVMVEASRGCQWGCRFCAAGFMYRPIRTRGLEELRASVREGLRLRQTIGLVGAEMASVPGVDALAEAGDVHQALDGDERAAAVVDAPGRRGLGDEQTDRVRAHVDGGEPRGPSSGAGGRHCGSGPQAGVESSPGSRVITVWRSPKNRLRNGGCQATATRGPNEPQ